MATTATTRARIKRASKKARQDLKRLDRESRKQLRALYLQARDDVQSLILSAEGLDGIVSIQQKNILLQQLNQRLAQLGQSRDESLGAVLRTSADSGVLPFASVGVQIQDLADQAVRQTINFIAADGLQLSDRIWRLENHTREIIANQVEQAIIRGDSATRAAREFIEKGLAVPADVQIKMGKAQAHKIAQATGADLMRKGGPYSNALRLFRTEINRAHGEAYQAAAFESPDVIGTQFLLSPNHPEPDICDMHAKVNRYGLGPGVYPKDKNPWPAHPNTLSFTVAVFDDEVTYTDEKGKETRLDWLKRQDPALQYGVLGASKKVLALELGLLKENQINTPWKVLKKYFEKRGHDPRTWARKPAAPIPPIPKAKPQPDKKPDPTPKGFKPAKTAKQASQWAVDENLVDFADYSGSSIDVANDWNLSVYTHITQFPELRPNLKFIGTIQGRNQHWRALAIQEYMKRLRDYYPDMDDREIRRRAERAVKRPRVSGNTYAQSTSGNDVAGVSVNKKWAANSSAFKNALQRDVDSGWHPIGTERVKSVIDHELGHQLDDLMDISRQAEVKELFRQWMYNQKEGEGLSRYARTNIKEFVAEAWAEYLNNPEPREMAQRIGTFINERYRSLYHG